MLLLVHEPRDDHDDEPPAARRRLPHIPWRPFAWFAAFCWLMLAAGRVGGLAGYGLVLLAISVGCWRVNRWLDGQDWAGMRNYTRGF